MARGWESKAVEAQQQDFAASTTAPRAVDPAALARQSELATLMLARTRALSDLQRACASAHRAMLEQAIADLDEKIRRLKP
jgi:hypothetical protein